jgi:glycosyltransferase involved in cell wall biosynthesis
MTQPIRVLHVIDSLDLGGAQTVLFNLLQNQNRARFAPEVAVLHGRGVFWKDFERLGVPLHSLSPIRELPIYLPRLAALLSGQRPDIVHCHLFASNWMAKPLAALFGVPVCISHDHCNDALRYQNRTAFWLDRWCHQFSSHVCAVSDSTRQFLVRDLGLSPERVTLIYNGIDLHRFQFKRRTDRPLRILGVGRLHPQKNFPLFLEVAAALHREKLGFSFQIAGTGPEEPLLRARIVELGLERCVELLGHVSDTPRLYADADVLLLTSRFEGTPMTALEAMASGLPIVAPKLDGLAEIFSHEQDALLVEPHLPGGFVDGLRRLAMEPGLAARIAEAARKKAETAYSAAAMTQRVESVYERFLKSAH